MVGLSGQVALYERWNIRMGPKLYNSFDTKEMDVESLHNQQLPVLIRKGVHYINVKGHPRVRVAELWRSRVCCLCSNYRWSFLLTSLWSNWHRAKAVSLQLWHLTRTRRSWAFRKFIVGKQNVSKFPWHDSWWQRASVISLTDEAPSQNTRCTWCKRFYVSVSLRACFCASPTDKREDAQNHLCSHRDGGIFAATVARQFGKSSQTRHRPGTEKTRFVCHDASAGQADFVFYTE